MRSMTPFPFPSPIAVDDPAATAIPPPEALSVTLLTSMSAGFASPAGNSIYTVMYRPFFFVLVV